LIALVSLLAVGSSLQRIQVDLLAGENDEVRRSTLDVRFCGKVVLYVEWLPEAVTRTSFKPGEWEDLLRRYDRIPAPAG